MCVQLFSQLFHVVQPGEVLHNLYYKVQYLNRANPISMACLLSFEQGIVLALLYICIL